MANYEEQKILTFFLDTEEYGISIKKVKELIGMMKITNVPKTPNFVKGVINLRGKIIPVIDLRIKFGLEEKEYTGRTCILVIEVLLSGKKKILGLIVDAVSEVVSLSSDNIDPPPEYAENVSTQNAILGMAKIGDEVVIILDTDKMFLTDEITRINTYAKEV
ncbi:MAG: chemotaxis protein CheW [Candidatus Gastranaerophilaceae bacterium]